jgi:hypothetical protein
MRILLAASIANCTLLPAIRRIPMEIPSVGKTTFSLQRRERTGMATPPIPVPGEAIPIGIGFLVQS